MNYMKMEWKCHLQMLSYPDLLTWYPNSTMLSLKLYFDWQLEVELCDLGKVQIVGEVAMVVVAFPFGASLKVSFCFATSLHDFF